MVETKNYLLEEIKQDEVMYKENPIVYMASNYMELLLILHSIINGCVSSFAFTSFLHIYIGIVGSAVGFKICAIIPRIKTV